MSFKERYDTLDRSVDYIRNVTVVVLAAFGAYWTATRANEILLPWTIMLFGGAIAYALFLPYKRALLVQDEWREAARVKALAAFFLGAPMYIVPAIVIYIFPDPASSLPSIQEAILSLQLEFALVPLERIILALLIGGIIGAVPSNKLYHRLLLRSGYPRDEIEETIRYKTGRSGVSTFGFSLIVVFAVIYLSAGTFNTTLSDQYFLSTLVLILLLVVHGWFFVTYTPPITKNLKHRILEYAFLLSIAVTIFSTSFTIVGGFLAFFILLILNHLSNQVRRETDLESYVKQQKAIEHQKVIRQNLRNMEQNLFAYIYYKLRPRVYNGIVIFALIWWLYIFYFIIEIGIAAYLLFLFPGVIVLIVPYLWLLWIGIRGKMDDIQREFEDKRAKGILGF
ncbi:MAG: hypothetical protein ACFFFC_10790 [Candidatus Thorarchaeota archaeon]